MSRCILNEVETSHHLILIRLYFILTIFHNFLHLSEYSVMAKCLLCQNWYFCKVYQSSWKYQVLHIARLALNNNHSLHYLFTKPYFLWFLNIFMMFTYLKLSMFVSSTGQNVQVKYYHVVTVVCYP